MSYKSDKDRDGMKKPSDSIGKSNPKKRRKKPIASRSLRTTEYGTSKPISNDPSWYFSDTILANGISDFSFNQFLGVPFTLGESIPSEVKFGSIATIWINPSAGWTNPTMPNVSGINMNGTKLFSTLSSRNAKTTSYAPQDVTTLMLALGSLIEYVEFLRRAFGLVFTYNNRNRAYARLVIESMGINFDDFIANVADYRNNINTLINMINQIPFPASFSYFEKCRSLFQNVYLDAVVNMAQSYIPCPYSVWILDEQYDEAGTGLSTRIIQANPGTNTMGYYISILSEMIQALLNSTTLNYVYSDILSFYDKQGATLLKMDMISPDYSVYPQYSETFLLQLKNSVIMGAPLPSSSQQGGISVTNGNDVKADASNNAILYTPQFKFNNPLMGLDAILNFKIDTPDVTMRVESTRYTVRGESILVEGDGYYTTSVAIPDHYIVSISLFSNTKAALRTLNSSVGTNFGGTLLCDVSRYSDMPFMYNFDTDHKFVGIYGDVEYFTTVGLKYLQALHDMCFMGLFELRK